MFMKIFGKMLLFSKVIFGVYGSINTMRQSHTAGGGRREGKAEWEDGYALIYSYRTEAMISCNYELLKTAYQVLF